MSIRKKLIGTKDFYKLVLSVAVPIMIQNGITNFVGLLDNIMVGQVGTEQMSGVAVATSCCLSLISVFSAPYREREYSAPSFTAAETMKGCAMPSVLSFGSAPLW